MTIILRASIFVVFLASASSAQTTFTNVSSLVPGLSQGKAAWADYNGDGLVDLHTVGSPTPPYGRIWKNNGGPSFTFTEQFSDIGEVGVWGDYNNDSFPDFLSFAGPGTAGPMLYKNNGASSFTQVSLPPLPLLNSRAASWADHDNDGYLDLYIGGFEDSVDSDPYYSDIILTNNGGTSFTHTWTQPNEAVVSPTQPRPARGVTSADFDRDGDADIYVSNYRLEPNQLRVNDGNGNFTNEAFARGVEGDPGGGVWGHTIGSAWGDFNNDGEMDLFVGNFAHADANQDRSKFYENLGPGGSFHFQDKGTLGLPYMESYSSPTLGDFDNDGDLDLFLTTTNLTQTGLGPNPGALEFGILYENHGNWVFSENTTAGLSGVITDSDQAGFADYDNDGDLDLLTDGRLYRNNGNSNNWLKVKLVGDGQNMNRDAVGAQVRIQHAGGTLLGEVQLGTGQGNMNEPTLHFGLGNSATPVTLDILWPGGVTQQVTGLSVDQLHTVNFALPVDEFQWIASSGSSWHSNSNWSPTGVPNGDDDIALLTGVVASATVIQVNSTATVGQIEMDGDSSYRLVGTGSLHLDEQNGTASISVTGGDHRIAVPLHAEVDTTLPIAAGASLTLASPFELDGMTVTKAGDGKLLVNGAAGAGSGTLEVTGGVLGGLGTISGNVTATAGIVAPGDDVGQLDITGNFTLAADATLQLDINGPSSPDVDLLDVDGSSTLGGSLEVVLGGGYQPAPGSQFLVFNSDSIVDSGLTLTGPNAGFFDLQIVGGSIVLQTLSSTDPNNDGMVDGTDFLILQRDNPGLIDAWALDYGGPPSTALATAAVPEPGTGTLLVLSGVLAGLVGLNARRSSRKKVSCCRLPVFLFFDLAGEFPYILKGASQQIRLGSCARWVVLSR